MKTNYAYLYFSSPPKYVPVSDEYPVGAFITGTQVTLVYENGKWLHNDEPDGGEFKEMPSPPKEVLDYLDSLLSKE
jgi:hypothetical protein